MPPWRFAPSDALLAVGARNPDELLAHPLRVREAYGAGDRFKILATILHTRMGSLRPQAFNRLGGCHPRCRKKGSRELSDAHVSDIGQPLDR